MVRDRTQRLLLWLLIPAGTLGFGIFLEYRGLDEGFGLPMAIASVVSGGVLASILALVFAAEALRQRRLAAGLKERLPAPRPPAPIEDRRSERHFAQVNRLKRQVDMLSAMRDLSLIANDEVDFEGILERALGIIAGLFDASEIQIFLNDPDATDGLRLAALRKRNKISFSEGEGSKGNRKAAQTALSERRSFYKLTKARLMAVSLLVADKEAVGSVAVFAPRRERDEEWGREFFRDLCYITKHIALVIRKPALYDRAVLDGLTGLYTKRHFLEQGARQLSAARRLGTDLTLIIVDIDHFKLVNDTHGHVTGDIVLAAVSELIRTAVREYDMVYRFGGEEICVVSPNCPLEAALALAERIRLKLEAAQIKGDAEQLVPITASLGVTAFKPDMKDIGAFVAAADSWLYKAKEEGRNQVRPAPEELERSDSGAHERSAVGSP